MSKYSKPETLFKEAESLVSVGRKAAALQSLTEVFASKYFRQTPLAALEPIMLYFVELCVELGRGRIAKEGLMQYKNIAQNTSIGSVENVIKRFVVLADAKVTEAQEKAEKAVALVDVDDLEATETPESILMGAVSGDQSKDRTDRALVTPALKFLWEAYRTALETLKNNARLEGIYQQIAQQAFKFCLKHQRKVEFRRLCETLRLHLSNVAKYAHQPHSINLGDPDTLQHHLDTRFAQLNASVELELWQEAFRSVEDIHNLLTMAKKSPRPAMMANYYEKLTRIFLTSGNALFHAASWARYYSIVKVLGGKSEEEISRLAGQVLISALAVPVGQETGEEEGRGRLTRLTALLGLTKMPTRTGLLKEALSRNVLKVSPQVVRNLYDILEVTFDPLTLCESVAPLLKELSEDSNYASYLPLLQRALLSRLLAQLAQVYTTMDLNQLRSLVNPLQGTFEGAYGPAQFEAFLMGCARRGDVRVRIDHASGSLTFVDEAFGNSAAGPSQPTAGALDKSIQPSATDLVRTRLSSIATCLHTALSVIEPPAETAEAQSKEAFAALVAAANAERKALQLRRAVVARRQILLKELSTRRETEEASRRAEASRRDREEQSRRQLEETRRKEQERMRREFESIKKEEARQLAQTLKERNLLKVDVEEIQDLDTDDLKRLQFQQLEKEKKEQSERTRIIAKRLDHIERAYRKEERPLLASDYEQQQRDDREAHEAAQIARIESARTAHAQAIETKHRLARVLGDYRERREFYISRRGEEFSRKRDDARKKIEDEKEKRRKAVLKAREEEHRRVEEEERIQREKEEEERRLEEERLENERRIEEEKAAAERKAEEERLAEEAKKIEQRKQRDAERTAAAEEARKRMQREEEAEARRAQRRAEERRGPSVHQGGRAETGDSAWRRPAPAAATTPSPTPTPTTAADGAAPRYRPGAFRGGAAGGGGGWREREAAKTAEGGAAPRRPESPAVQPPAPAPAESGWRSREAARAAAEANAPRRAESPANPPAAQNDDGFQTVPARGVWRSSRGRGGRS